MGYSPLEIALISVGMVKEKVAPMPDGLFEPHIFPPWASTIFFDRYNPRPVPPFDLLANLSKSLFLISRSIPNPESSILNIMELSSCLSMDIAMVPLSVNLRALSSRL